MTTVRHDPPSPHGSIVAGQAMTPPATPQPQLLPCAWCGHPPEMTYCNGGTAIECGNYKCPTQPFLFREPDMVGKDYQAIAISDWNTRADSAALQSLREERDALELERKRLAEERAYNFGVASRLCNQLDQAKFERNPLDADAARWREALEWCERAMGWATAGDAPCHICGYHPGSAACSAGHNAPPGTVKAEAGQGVTEAMVEAACIQFHGTGFLSGWDGMLKLAKESEDYYAVALYRDIIRKVLEAALAARGKP